MLLRLILLFTLIPLVEAAILFYIADHTSWLFTLGLIVLTGIVGAALARREGWRCIQTIQDRVRRGELPADSLFDGLLILIAGTLLITPGILTDIIGFLLLVPGFRRHFRRRLGAHVKTRIRVIRPDGTVYTAEETSGDSKIIDVKLTDEDPDQPGDWQETP